LWEEPSLVTTLAFVACSTKQDGHRILCACSRGGALQVGAVGVGYYGSTGLYAAAKSV